MTEPLGDIVIVAAAAATILQALISTVRMGVDLPRWGPPALALLLGPLVVLGVLTVQAPALALTAQTVALVALAGVLAAAGAVGAHELGKHAERGQRR